jgi:hypothetical protein
VSPNIQIDVSELAGGAAAFRSYPERLQTHLLEAMTGSMHEVTKEQKDRIPVVTGTLRREWNEKLPPDANSSGLGYTGTIGTNLAYAAAVEFGFQGIETVRAHIRSIAFGRTVTPFTVPAHTRVANQPARHYAADGLNAARDTVEALHRKAITDTFEEMKNAR